MPLHEAQLQAVPRSRRATTLARARPYTGWFIARAAGPPDPAAAVLLLLILPHTRRRRPVTQIPRQRPQRLITRAEDRHARRPNRLHKRIKQLAGIDADYYRLGRSGEKPRQPFGQ